MDRRFTDRMSAAKPGLWSAKASRFCASLAVICIVGCSEKKQETSYSRVPGLDPGKSAEVKLDQQPSATARDSAPQVNMASLKPGKPDASSTAGSVMAPFAGGGAMSGAPPLMSGGIPQAPETKVLIGGNKLQVAGVAFTIPEGWKSVKPASTFRAAQFEIAGSGGTAELAVFYFGPGQGGTVEDNVKRWAGQFSSDDPSTTTVPTDVAQVANGELSLALVRASGTYNPGSMGPGMGGASEPKPNYALLGLVVVGGPEGPIFIKATGPKATLDEQAKSFETFARSAKKSNYK